MIAKVIITGATSSLGIALIKECLSSGIDVIAIVNNNSKNISRIPIDERIMIIECGLSEYYALLETDLADVNADAFFHFAWASTNGDTARDMLEPQVMNIKYALEAVSLARACNCRVFVGAGSQAEYGRKNEDLHEDLSCNPESAYGMAKLCAGQMTRLACKQKGIKHVWARILSGYGPCGQSQSILQYTLSELIEGREPQLTNGDQIWNFMFTSDIARALLLLADKGRDGEIYVIGNKESGKLRDYLITARDVLIEMKRACGDLSDTPLLNFGAKEYTDRTVMHLSCLPQKLANDTGFTCKYSFRDGITETIKWIMKEK